MKSGGYREWLEAGAAVVAGYYAAWFASRDGVFGLNRASVYRGPGELGGDWSADDGIADAS